MSLRPTVPQIEALRKQLMEDLSIDAPAVLAFVEEFVFVGSISVPPKTFLYLEPLLHSVDVIAQYAVTLLGVILVEYDYSLHFKNGKSAEYTVRNRIERSVQ